MYVPSSSTIRISVILVEIVSVVDSDIKDRVNDSTSSIMSSSIIVISTHFLRSFGKFVESRNLIMLLSMISKSD